MFTTDSLGNNVALPVCLLFHIMLTKLGFCLKPVRLDFCVMSLCFQIAAITFIITDRYEENPENL